MKLQVKTGVLLIITLEVICVTSWKSSYILHEILNETEFKCHSPIFYSASRHSLWTYKKNTNIFNNLEYNNKAFSAYLQPGKRVKKSLKKKSLSTLVVISFDHHMVKYDLSPMIPVESQGNPERMCKKHMKSWGSVNCWQGYSNANDPMPQTHGNGKAFWTKVRLWEMPKPFSCSSVNVDRVCKHTLFMNYWSMCVSTRNHSLLFLNAYNLRLLARKDLPPNFSPCAVYNNLTKVPGGCRIGST